MPDWYSLYKNPQPSVNNSNIWSSGAKHFEIKDTQPTKDYDILNNNKNLQH